jgi:prolyl oligopeptidase
VRWAAEKDKKAQEEVSTPETAKLEARIAELLDVDVTSAPRRFGQRNFFTRIGRKDAKPRYFYDENGTEVLWLDTNELNGSVSAVVPSWDGRKVAYKLHPKYNDFAHLVVRDLSAGAPGKVIADLPGARYAYPSWTPASDGFFYTDLPPKPEDMPEADHPGLQQIVHYSLANVKRVVVPPSHDPQQFLSAECTRDGRFLVRSRTQGWDQSRLDILRLGKGNEANGSWEELSVGRGVFFSMHHNGTFFVVQTGGDAPRGRVLAVPDASLADQKELIQERADVLRSVDLVGGHLVLQYLHDMHPYVEVRDLDGGLVRTFGLPSGAANALVQDAGCALMPSPDGRGLGVISAFAGEPEQVRAFFSVEAPLHPPAILAVDLPNGEFELWNQRHVPFEATGGISATQVFAKDGDVRVPSLLLKPDTPGPMRTLLYGYGGFGTILYPSFRSHALAWVELGNAYVVANLRGGGEYGQEWHEDGKGLQKQHVFDDFAAVAQHLIATNVTTPAQLMAEGGSNGGLLVGAAITQRPELFGAAVVAVPLLDMVRYTEFDSGATWIPEYGDPRNATEFSNLFSYSPYHNVRTSVRYPAVLLESTASDDRVSPMHARKFFARLEDAGHNAWLRVRNGGHSGVASRREYARGMAESLGFGLRHLESAGTFSAKVVSVSHQE